LADIFVPATYAFSKVTAGEGGATTTGRTKIQWMKDSRAWLKWTRLLALNWAKPVAPAQAGMTLWRKIRAHHPRS
jgi:hypothetical protein